MDRRDFLKTAGVAMAASMVGPGCTLDKAPPDDAGFSILIDTTRCEGCGACLEACAKANDLPVPEGYPGDAVRDTDIDRWAVVNAYDTSKGELFARRQCMHCLQPACVSACLTGAMTKTPEGPVVWRADQCMGCRYCMVSCPFDAPRFEYHSANPRILKCRMCWERAVEGGTPACVADCPAEALFFGQRGEVLAEAHRRIAEDPEAYLNHIYGEHEAGGTGVLYLSSVPFEELGLRTDLDDESYPALTREFLYAVPMVLTVGPALLLALHHATGNRDHPDDASEP